MNVKIFCIFFIALFAVALCAPKKGGGEPEIRKKIIHHHWVTKTIPKIIYYTKVIPRPVPYPVYIPSSGGGGDNDNDGGDNDNIIGGGGLGGLGGLGGGQGLNVY
jgi:hypothetical protein